MWYASLKAILVHWLIKSIPKTNNDTLSTKITIINNILWARIKREDFEPVVMFSKRLCVREF